MSARSGFVTLRSGARIAYEIHGAEHGGTPALLLRPLVGAMALWGSFRDVLAEHLRVIAFDPLGTGGSSDAALLATTRDMAHDARAVLDALGVTTAHVFGISFGGMVATWLAIDAPGRVSRLCLASVGPSGCEVAPSAIPGGVALAASLLVPGVDVSAHLADAVLSDRLREEEPERVVAIEEAAAADPTDRVELAKHAVAAARHDARDELQRIVAPTLVLAGDHDELLGAQPTIELTAAIYGARREVIIGAGHDLTLERPTETAHRVAAFFLEGEP